MAIQGLESLRRKLNALPDAMRAEVRLAMQKGAEEIVQMARRLAPEASGDLKKSIGWTWGAAPQGSMALANAGSGADVLTIYAGSDEAFYARWIEFGTVSRSATPFFYPSYRATRKKMRSRNNRAMRKAARKVAGLT
jgi:HK97 gp10 family phage protein